MTDKQRERIIKLIGQGYSRSGIAKEMQIPSTEVNSVVALHFRKPGAKKRSKDTRNDRQSHLTPAQKMAREGFDPEVVKAVFGEEVGQYAKNYDTGEDGL